MDSYRSNSSNRASELHVMSLKTRSVFFCSVLTIEDL